MPRANSERLAAEAKGIVVLAFRNGPMEAVHAGKRCPTCHGKREYSHITDAEMKAIMKNAVDHVHRLFMLRYSDLAEYERQIVFGLEYARNWDEPELVRSKRK